MDSDVSERATLTFHVLGSVRVDTSYMFDLL